MTMNSINSVNKDDIEQKIMAIVVEKVTTNDDFVSTATVHDLGLDSLDLIEIVLEIEDSFNCQIDDAKIEQLETIQEIIDYVYGVCRKQTANFKKIINDVLQLQPIECMIKNKDK